MSTTSSTPSHLPSPPFIPIDHIPNFRTIGAHPSSSDAQLSTRPDYVYRCGAPTGHDDATLSTLQSLRISVFYDLRSAREIERLKERAPIINFPGIERVFCPVFLNAQERDYDPQSLARRMADYASPGPEGFVRAYKEILDEGKSAYRTVFEHVRDRPNEPFVVHCTAGKDRTGVLVALMFELVGVRDEDIADEYHLTEMGLASEIEKWIPHMAKEPAFQSDEERVRRTLSAKKEAMLGMLKMLRETYGSAEGYLVKHLGFSEEDVATIRKNLSEPRK